MKLIKKIITHYHNYLGFLADVTQEWADGAGAVKCELEGLDASNARKQESRALHESLFQRKFPCKNSSQ